MAPRKTPGITARTNTDGSTSYRIRWRQGGGAGPQLTHTFDRRAEAADILNKIKANGNVCDCPIHGQGSTEDLREQAERVGIATETITFGLAATAHADRLTGIGEGYRAQFLRDLDRHFSQFLDRPLADITATDVKEWLRGCETGSHPWLLRKLRGRDVWAGKPLGVRTMRRLTVQAGAIYRARGLEDPFAGHRLGQDGERAMRALTPEQWALICDELPAGRARDLCRALLGTGARFGEMTALRVGDVDPFRRTLRIEQAWKSDGKNGFVLGPPKSRKSRRVIDLDEETLDALLPHLAGRDPDALVFTASRGTPVRSANFSHRVWRPAVERAVAKGLPFRPRLHDLRHTCATWLISGGVSIIAVSRQLGHQSVAITGDLYSHVLPRDRDRATSVMSAALAASRTPLAR